MRLQAMPDGGHEGAASGVRAGSGNATGGGTNQRRCERKSMIHMREYVIRLAKQSCGKAGKGHNKTSTVQVIYESCIVKAFRFFVDDPASRAAAWRKAKEYVQLNGKVAGA